MVLNFVILTTDTDLEGYGLTFTLGRGNEVVAKMCESLEPLVVGKDFEKDILADLMGFSRELTQDGQLRWLGPEKVHLAPLCCDQCANPSRSGIVRAFSRWHVAPY